MTIAFNIEPSGAHSRSRRPPSSRSTANLVGNYGAIAYNTDVLTVKR